MNCEDVRPLLNARMDGEVDAVQLTAVDSHLESCSACAADFAELESVRHAVRSPLLYRKASPELRDQLRFALRGAEYLDRRVPRTGWRVWGAIAAGIALVALASAPFLVNSRNQSRLVAEELLSAHERALLGKGVDVVSSDQHTVKPWFNGRVPFSPPVVNLISEGFPLEGGRLDYADGHPVAALVYSRRLHRIDVFVWPSPGQKAPPAHFQRNGYNEITWTKNSFVFTAVSDLNTAELESFAVLLQNR